MNWGRIFAISVSFIMLAVPSFAAGNGFARISLIQGDVLVKTEDSPEWVPASINTPIGEGDSIWSPDGARVEIQLKNGSFIRLDRQSSLDVVTVEDDYLQFHLGMGRLYVKTGDMNDRSMQVDFRDSSVKVYDRARFRIDLEENGDEEISIFKGSAYVESAGSKTKVRAGEMLSLEDRSGNELSVLKAPDAWETWNSERDRVTVVRKTERTYLPEDLEAYAPELESNGRWEQVPEYGYVWRPTIIAAGWAPYTVGRWVWRRGDYVWVSYENWGWAPYHYGRWVNVGARGWCWVPPARGDVFWSPGYVGWISTPAYVGWVPLAPGEPYYGYGYYGRNSVNISITNIHVHEKRKYRNIHVHNAVTVVHKDSFASGKIVRVKPKENIFIKEKVVVVRPQVKPSSREAYMPVVKHIAPNRLPPAVVTKVKVKELKARHPRIKDVDGWDDKRRRQPEQTIKVQPVEEKRQSKPEKIKEVQPEQKMNPSEIRRQEKEREKDLRNEEKERRKEDRNEAQERKEQLKQERRQLKEQQKDSDVKGSKREQAPAEAGKPERRDKTWDSDESPSGRRERREPEAVERQSHTVVETPQEGKASGERQIREEKKSKKVWKIRQKEQKEPKEQKEQKEHGKRER